MASLPQIGFVARPAPGALLGPDSVSWRLNSTWPVILGGQAAILLQVAHPAVGAGVASYSAFKTDPYGRLYRTLDSMLTISFGSPERREAMLKHLHGMHRPVSGELSDGTKYRALDPGLQFWVHATLVHVALEIDRRYLRMLKPAEREQFYQESKLMARAFRVPNKMIPENLASFRQYVDGMVAAMEVTEEARDTMRAVTKAPSWFLAPVQEPLKLVTRDLLPPHLAEQFGLKPLTLPERVALLGSQQWTRGLAKLPAPLLANPLNRGSVA